VLFKKMKKKRYVNAATTDQRVFPLPLATSLHKVNGSTGESQLSGFTRSTPTMTSQLTVAKPVPWNPSTQHIIRILQVKVMYTSSRAI